MGLNPRGISPFSHRGPWGSVQFYYLMRVPKYAVTLGYTNKSYGGAGATHCVTVGFRGVRVFISNKHKQSNSSVSRHFYATVRLSTSSLNSFEQFEGQPDTSLGVGKLLGRQLQCTGIARGCGRLDL